MLDNNILLKVNTQDPNIYICDLKWYTDKAQPNTWKAYHVFNINTKINFVLEHNIPTTRRTHSDASWSPICWDILWQGPIQRKHHLVFRAPGSFNDVELFSSMVRAWISLCDSWTKSVTTKQRIMKTPNNLGRVDKKHDWYHWIPWWRHQMETFSALLALCVGNSLSPVNSPRKGLWRGALILSLICAWINGWVNDRKAGGLRRHRVHYDATVMHGIRLAHCAIPGPQHLKLIPASIHIVII